MMQGIDKCFIHVPAICPLQTILLIAVAFDIELVAVWISIHENMIADAAFRYNFHKLRRLGLTAQVNALFHPTNSIDISVLRQKLLSFFTTPSHHRSFYLFFLSFILSAFYLSSVVFRSGSLLSYAKFDSGLHDCVFH
jgi:hypothetical protein